MDIRQSKEWGNYLSQIKWEIKKLDKNQVFIRPIPLIRRSIIKIQHPQNPLNFQQIDQLAQKKKALFVLLEPESQGYDEALLIENGYQKSTMSLTHTATIYLDLQRFESEIWATLSENARRNIKKAQKNNLVVKKILLKDEADDKEFRKFYQLLTNLTKLKKFYVPGYNEFYKKMLAFKKTSILLFALEKENPQPIAVVWLGVLKNTAVYMNTGITKKGYKFLANYLLVWEAIKLAKDLNLKIFDFEGIFDHRFPQHRKSWQKFSEFKKRFHGTLIEYPPPWIKIYSKFYKLIYLCNKVFSN